MRRTLLVLGILSNAGPALADDDPCAEVVPTPDVTDPAPINLDRPTPIVPVVEPPVAAGRVRVRGKFVGKKTGEALIGVTVVFTSPSIIGEEVVIGDEYGTFYIDVVPGTYTMTTYYASNADSVPNLKITEATWIGITMLDEESKEPVGGCVFWSDHHSPDLASMPRFGVHVGRREPIIVSRDRTHRAWIAPAAAADPLTALVTLNGGMRLQSAPGVPIAFVEDSSVQTMRIPIDVAAGSGGGVDVGLRGGSNTTHGDARLVLGRDRGGSPIGAEIVASGPMKRDKAWITAGLVANRTADDTIDVDGLVTTNIAFTQDHQLGVAGLVQRHGDDVRDSWTSAQWVSKLNEGKLQLQGTVTAEQLQLPGAAALATTPLANAIDRVGGKVGTTIRYKWGGYHLIAATAAAAGGHRGDDLHREATFAVGDNWQIVSNIELAAGVRSDTRMFEDDRATVTSPRAHLNYDPTKEGRSEIFVAYQRVPKLDDGLPGDWRALADRSYDEIAIGSAWLHESFKLPMVGIATRIRWTAGEPEAGVEGWLRHETRKMTIHVGATSLGRIGTVMAQRGLYEKDRNELLAAATLRASADRTEGGGALVWRHRGATGDDKRDDLSLDVTLEGHGGTDGPGGRVLMGMTW